MSQKTLHIAYDGPALDTHEMDVRELAPALLAFSDMFEEANAVLNGDRAKISLNVKGSFKTGSFVRCTVKSRRHQAASAVLPRLKFLAKAAGD
jgi:hypothetical protein